jgi:hypothetical protein
MLILTYLGEIWNELTFTAMIGQIWILPLLICMVALNLGGISKWVLYAVLMIILSGPSGKLTSGKAPLCVCVVCVVDNMLILRHLAHPIQVGWNSRNANAVRSRTVSAACYNMFVQAGGIIGSNVYRAGKPPSSIR